MNPVPVLVPLVPKRVVLSHFVVTFCPMEVLKNKKLFIKMNLGYIESKRIINEKDES